MILHITSKQDWEKAQIDGEYKALSLKTEGFIHCSTITGMNPRASPWTQIPSRVLGRYLPSASRDCSTYKFFFSRELGI